MKPEDKVSILESSSVSVLESTRKDFEALLSSAYSSTSEDQSSSTKSNSRKTLPRKKRLNKNEENPPLEMVNLTPDRKSSSSKQSSGEINTAFWYEKDDKQSEGASSPSHSSSAKSSSKITYKTVGKSAQPLRVASSSSVVEHRVIVHNGHDSAESISEESEIQSSRRPPSSFRAASSLASSKSKSHKQPKSSRRSTSRLSISDRESEASTGSSSSERQERHIPYGCSMLKLIVHHSGCLILDQPKARPMVIVHALDSQSGSYLQQSGLAVPPQFTAAWTQQESASSEALPSWNQQLVFHFDVGQQLTNILLLFELVSEPNGGSGSDQQCQLAWGFLRPVSRTGVKHTNKKVQLQLYQIPPLRRRFHSSSIKANVSDFFSCFRNQQRDKYPATLYVTLSPNETNTVETSPSHSQSQQQLVDKNLISLTSPLRRGRLGGQPFKLPTRRCFTFGSKFGALVASYNRDGTLLAVALTSGDIYLHCISDKTEPVQLRGHQGNVYDLDWATDEFVLSSGADCTARLWNLKMVGSSSILAHPAYVYSARFGSEDRIVTACYDQLIRLWQSTRLVASYTQHNAPVNSLAWDTRHELLYSGDASGLICLWNTDHSVELQFEKTLNESSEECRTQTPINWLCIHPSGKRILVHFRGNNIILMDPKSGLKLLTYNGIYNPRLRLTSSISPCGNFVVAGSEDGSVHWFDLERGDLMAITTLTESSSAVTSIAFHPTDHLVALSTLNPSHALCILQFNKDDGQQQQKGFSLVTFPRTVQSATFPIENVSRVVSRTSDKTTPTLDKLERIFRKLDLVMAWSHSTEQQDTSTVN